MEKKQIQQHRSGRSAEQACPVSSRSARRAWALLFSRRLPVAGLAVVCLASSAPAQLWIPSGEDLYFLDGRVGIGTTTPDSSLDIEGTARVQTGTNGNYYVFQAIDTHDFAPAEFQGQRIDGGPELSIYHNSAMPANSNSSGIRFHGNNSALTKTVFGQILARYVEVTNGGESANLEFNLSHNGAVETKATLTSAGSFGLGTQTPAATFDVRGTGMVKAATNGDFYAFRAVDTQDFAPAEFEGQRLSIGPEISLYHNSAVPSSSDGSGIRFHGNNSALNKTVFGKLAAKHLSVLDGNETANLEINLSHEGTLQNTAVFTSVGNVGIGTTTPTEKLEVNGNITASGTICDINGCIGGDSSQWVEGPAGAYYYNSGNLGIGTGSPTARLHVVGLAKIATDSASNVDVLVLLHPDTSWRFHVDAGDHAELGVSSGGTTHWNALDFHPGTGNLGLGTDGESGHRLTVEGSQQISGNLGLGTPAESAYRLKIEGDQHISGNIVSAGEICIGSGC